MSFQKRILRKKFTEISNTLRTVMINDILNLHVQWLLYSSSLGSLKYLSAKFVILRIDCLVLVIKRYLVLMLCTVYSNVQN